MFHFVLYLLGPRYVLHFHNSLHYHRHFTNLPFCASVGSTKEWLFRSAVPPWLRVFVPTPRSRSFLSPTSLSQLAADSTFSTTNAGRSRYDFTTVPPSRWAARSDCFIFKIIGSPAPVFVFWVSMPAGMLCIFNHLLQHRAFQKSNNVDLPASPAKRRVSASLISLKNLSF